jgi:hypothetical protein
MLDEGCLCVQCDDYYHKECIEDGVCIKCGSKTTDDPSDQKNKIELPRDAQYLVEGAKRIILFAVIGMWIPIVQFFAFGVSLTRLIKISSVIRNNSELSERACAELAWARKRYLTATLLPIGAIIILVGIIVIFEEISR